MWLAELNSDKRDFNCYMTWLEVACTRTHYSRRLVKMEWSYQNWWIHTQWIRVTATGSRSRCSMHTLWTTPQSDNRVLLFLHNNGLSWTVSAPDKVTAVPLRRNGNFQTPISVPAVRPKWCHTLSNPAHRQNHTVACLNYTLQTMMPLPGWPVMAPNAYNNNNCQNYNKLDQPDHVKLSKLLQKIIKHERKFLKDWQKVSICCVTSQIGDELWLTCFSATATLVSAQPRHRGDRLRQPS